ncbi:MAG TPA: alpha-amylase family protein, partial [Chryseolinea sp.]|nr:alpha-amylase family protein [Chryseolinea sp.]
MRGLIPCLTIIALLIGCSKQKEKIPPLMSDDNGSGKIAVYQVMTRLFGNKGTTNKPYGTRDENGVGKFNDVDARALKAIRDLGITHVWYTGVIEHALLTDYSAQGIAADDPDVVKGIAGSPYAIKDYYDVNPDLAVNVANRMAEFEQLIRRTHENGLKVIIDFVPNHVARRYHSDKRPAGVNDLGEKDVDSLAFSAANNFYYLPGTTFQPPRRVAAPELGLDGKFDEMPAKVTGNNVFSATPNINDWYETVKLNYGVDYQDNHAVHFDPVPDTWIKMRDILKFWASKDIDGFRCDMAEMVPVEFWHWVIPQVKADRDDLIFIAEIYNPGQYRNYLENGGFNYLYDKVQLYDTLRLLLAGQQNTREIADIRTSLNGINDNMLHFMENHDEHRIASKFFAGDPWKAVPAMVVSATLDRGAVMVYFGQEVGEPAAANEGYQGDDGRTTIYDYWGVPEHQKWMNRGTFNGDSLSLEQKQLRMFYTDLLNLATSNGAIAMGDYEDLTVHNQTAGNFNNKIHAFVRFSGDERLLILTSF